MIYLQQLATPEATETFEWFDKVSIKFLIRLGIDLTSVLILVRFIYYRHYRRSDLFLTFVSFNFIIFLLTFLLNKTEMSMGAAFGLFAVFSMLRYRTEGISTKDMTYLFMVIAIGLVSAISKGSWDDLLLHNAIIIAIVAILESNWLVRREYTKPIQYDNILLITPEKRPELLTDLREKTGLNIHRVDIEEYNLTKNVVKIVVYYYE